MRRLPLGVMGHVDHGKTALVRALTGIDTDRLPEEKRRGISIALGFAYVDLGDTVIDLIDMPGHERFVRTMVSGATGASGALLVVAANEGVKPQTVEHLQVASLLGVSRILPVVSKTDLVVPDEAAQRAREIIELLDAAGLSGAPPVLVSAQTGAGLDGLRAALAMLAEATPPAEDDGYPYLPIDRAFSLAGHGTVVTGTLRRGGLAADQPLVAAPSATELRVRGLQVHGHAVSRAQAGQRVAVNLRGVEAGEIRPGAALTPPGLLTRSHWLDVDLRSLPDAPPLRNGMRLVLLFGTAETTARLRLLDRDLLQPGRRALAQLHCEPAVAIPARERFILRRASPAATLAGGRVLDPGAQRRRRNDPAVLTALQALAEADPAGVVAEALLGAGPAGVTVARLAQLSGLAPERADDAALALGAVAAGARRLTPEALSQVGEKVLSTLAEHLETQPDGMAPRRLQGVTGLPAEIVAAAVQALAGQGRLRQDGRTVRLPPRAGEDDARARQEAALDAKLARLFLQGGLTPPDPTAVADTVQGRRALERLVRAGVVVKTYDRVQKREILFHREAVEAAKAALAPRLVGPGLLVKDAGAALGISRKFSVPLLEYLDGVRFTRRVGDRRLLGPHA